MNEEYPIIEGQFTFHKIEEDEVMQLLSGLKVNKAVDADGISAKLL